MVIKPVVCGIIRDSRGWYLIAQRNKPPDLAGRWEFPGGKVEYNETTTEALQREIREELGVEIKILAPYHQEYVVWNHGTFFLMYYACTIADDQIPLRRQVADAKFVSRDELQSVDLLPVDKSLARRLYYEAAQVWGERPRTTPQRSKSSELRISFGLEPGGENGLIIESLVAKLRELGNLKYATIEVNPYE